MVISKVMRIQDTAIENVNGVDYVNVGEIYGVEASTPAPTTGTFSFDITIAGADTFELPINAGGMGYIQDFTVDWGDTNSSTITSYDDADRTHSYAGAGTYTVVLDGTCQWFAFQNAGDKDLVVELNAFTDDMQFEVLNFRGCSNLATICVLGTMASLKNSDYMFKDCSSLTTIPIGLFDGCSGMGNTEAFKTTFNNSGITSIPVDLFKYQTTISGVAFNNTFSYCSDLTSIPENLFRYNTALSYDAFNSTFSNCTGLTAIPAGLFLYNTSISGTNFVYTFTNCTSLTAVPTDLFRYNTSLGGLQYTFYLCSSLATVPSGLFKYNSVATSFLAVFQDCPKLQLISDLFCDADDEGTRFLNKSPNFSYLFDRSTFTGTQGAAPDLWDGYDYGTGTPTTTDCYGGSGNSATSISNYLDIPAGYK